MGSSLSILNCVSSAQSAGQRMRLKRLGVALLLLVLAGGIVVGGGCRPAFARAKDNRVELVVWGVWYSEGMSRVLTEFIRRHPNIKLVTSSSGGGMDEQKLMCGIAGGSPPDVINKDRFAVPAWAARAAFIPLDDFLKADAGRADCVKLDDYYEACRAEATYQGKVYAIPIGADDRALYYNEDLLRREGFVDEDGKVVPPRTWDELLEYAKRLTKKDVSGSIAQIGFIPNYGNSWLYIYGWQNGGEFMSADGRTCTLNDPRIVEALDWVTGAYDAMGGAARVDAFQASFQGGELDAFITGKVAMKVDGNWSLGGIATNAPDMHLGVAPAPVPKGRPFITWSGGWSWAIPKGARHPKEAWEFIRWISSDECRLMQVEADYRYALSRGRIYVPGITANRKINDIVFAKHAPKEERFRTALRTFLDLMEVSKWRPVTPVAQVLWDEHVRAMDQAIRHKYSPKRALDMGTRRVQEQLDLLYHAKVYPRLNGTYPLAILGALGCAILILAGVGFVREVRVRGKRFRRATLDGLVFAAPWIVGFVCFTAGPILASIVLSFCKYDALHPVEWVGLDNYRNLIGLDINRHGSIWPWNWSVWASDPLFYKSLANTAFMLLGIPLGMTIGLAVAMLLNTNVRGMSVYRTIYYLPAVVPVVASAVLWIWVLNPEFGLVNSFLKLVGLGGPLWLQSEQWSKPSLIFMGLWGAGAGMIIWLAGLKGIPQQLYEAADIDGAGWWARLRHVTLPMLSPYIFFNLVMGTIGTLQIFTQAYIMTAGGPADSTMFYVYYLFNNSFRYFKMGYASAMAWILFIFVAILTAIQIKLAPRWVHYETT